MNYRHAYARKWIGVVILTGAFYVSWSAVAVWASSLGSTFEIQTVFVAIGHAAITAVVIGVPLAFCGMLAITAYERVAERK